MTLFDPETLNGTNKMENDSFEKYDQLLQDSAPILREWKAHDRLRPPAFNIFRTLGLACREVNTHSAMIVHLLDPNSSHAQGTLFLENFLEIVSAACIKQGMIVEMPKVDNHSLWNCRKEVSLPEGLGQVDIILTGPKLLILIENKIFAGDQKEQLQRYWTFAEREVEGQNILPLIIYLTPYGHPPTDQSIGPSSELQHNLILLSYHEHIFQLIARCLPKIDAISVSEILQQYASLVKEL